MESQNYQNLEKSTRNSITWTEEHATMYFKHVTKVK